MEAPAPALRIGSQVEGSTVREQPPRSGGQCGDAPVGESGCQGAVEGARDTDRAARAEPRRSPATERKE
eukprot:7441914-Alexandrium_andersonii.AAC.1